MEKKKDKSDNQSRLTLNDISNIVNTSEVKRIGSAKAYRVTHNVYIKKDGSEHNSGSSYDPIDKRVSIKIETEFGIHFPLASTEIQHYNGSTAWTKRKLKPVLLPQLNQALAEENLYLANAQLLNFDGKEVYFGELFTEK